MDNVERAREIAACPFCGGDAGLCSYPSCDCCGKAYNAGVACNTPGCNVTMDHYDTDEEAIAAWNNRAVQSDMMELVEAAKVIGDFGAIDVSGTAIILHDNSDVAKGMWRDFLAALAKLPGDME